MKRFYSFLLTLIVCAGTMLAESVQIADLYYNLNPTYKTAEVTYHLQWSHDNYADLTAVVIPSSVEYESIEYAVTSIGDFAFEYCADLTSIEIPNSITSIGHAAFYMCSGLVGVVIPNSVINCGNEAFYECINLTNVVLSNQMTTISEASFELCSKLSDIVIPNSVQYIGNKAFYGCSSLTDIEIPHSVINIGDEAFRDCTSLTSAIIGNGVTNIGGSAFIKCEALTSLSFGSNVNTIGSLAFAYCNGLKSIDLPASVKNIGDWTFMNCYGLTHIICRATTPPDCGVDAFGYIDIPVFVPEEVVEDYKNAPYWSGFTTITAIRPPSVVKFLDWNGTELASMQVNYGDAATPPADPSRTGYTFIGWDQDFNFITENLTVVAMYTINKYHVEFRDWDGALLKEESVEYLSSAIPPETPNRDWYTFIGWDNDFNSIIGDLIVTAQYKEGRTLDLSLVFSNSEDNSEITKNPISIDFPVPPVIAGFTFIGWQPVASIIADVIEIQAIYEYNGIPTDAPAMVTNPSNPSQKLIRNGNIYILGGDKTYTITGQQVK